MNTFHMAFPVRDLDSTRAFYVDLLGCPAGRSAERWLDFNFFGHQLSAHVAEDAAAAATNVVDGDAVPVRHFGCILPWDEWRALADKLEAAKVPFIIEPRVRFEGLPGEQGTFFVRDPSGNALEFKSFKDIAQVFATE